MKKSNIILLATFGLAFTWTLFVGGLGAAAINNFLQGHFSTYVFTSDEHKMVDIPSSLATIKELRIVDNRSAIIILRTGTKFSVDCMRRNRSYIKVTNQNGIATIQVEKLPNKSDLIKVTIPELVKITTDNLYDLALIGVVQNNLRLCCRQTQIIDIDSCKIRRVKFDFPGITHKNNVIINETNRFDSLSVFMDGYGSLRMGCVAKSQNLLQVSPKVEINARQEIYKQLTISSILKADHK